MSKQIYLDNAATTRPYTEAVEAAMPYLSQNWGNPSGAYSFAYQARVAVQKARQEIAETLGAEPGQIFFTSGATESNNTVIHTACNKKILTTPIEHHAILRPSERVADPLYLPVDKMGRVNPQDVTEAILNDSRISLVSVMAANNEIGTIEPIREIGQICKDYNVIFHTDATQYYGHMPLNVNEIDADFVSASAHKFGGIKGTGFLYVRKGISCRPFIDGGLQERGLRAGTQNVFGIVAMAEAAKISCSTMFKEAVRLKELRDYLIDFILSEVTGARLTGDPVFRLANNASFVFEGVRGEELLQLLDLFGISCSTGSACETGSDEPSHVLKAIGLSDEEANGSLRLTLGKDTTRQDLEYAAHKIKESVDLLRDRVT